MWNFLVHGLSVGCTLVLYDGSPLRDPAFLWNLVDELGISIFGTSAKYIDQLSVSVFAHIFHLDSESRCRSHPPPNPGPARILFFYPLFSFSCVPGHPIEWYSDILSMFGSGRGRSRDRLWVRTFVFVLWHETGRWIGMTIRK